MAPDRRVYFPGATESVEVLLRSQLDAGVELSTGDALPDPAQYRLLIAGRPTREQLDASPELTTLLIPFAGLPKSTVETLVDYPQIAVHNLHHNAAPTAEMAMALMLSAAKEVIPLDAKLRLGDWTPRYDFEAGTLLAGKTALILGYGAIGRRVARICTAFDMNVIAVRRSGESTTDGDVSVRPAKEFPSLWSTASFVVICLPLTPETEGLIGATELAAMPNDTVLVNIGRAPIVDEAALFEALQSKSIAAAGLDVWYRYPEDKEARTSTLPSEYAFHELDNVVLSPHRAGHTEAVDKLRAHDLAVSINAHFRGDTMPHAVDVARGY